MIDIIADNNTVVQLRMNEKFFCLRPSFTVRLRIIGENPQRYDLKVEQETTAFGVPLRPTAQLRTGLAWKEEDVLNPQAGDEWRTVLAIAIVITRNRKTGDWLGYAPKKQVLLDACNHYWNTSYTTGWLDKRYNDAIERLALTHISEFASDNILASLIPYVVGSSVFPPALLDRVSSRLFT